MKTEENILILKKKKIANIHLLVVNQIDISQTSIYDGTNQKKKKDCFGKKKRK